MKQIRECGFEPEPKDFPKFHPLCRKGHTAQWQAAMQA